MIELDRKCCYNRWVEPKCHGRRSETKVHHTVFIMARNNDADDYIILGALIPLSYRTREKTNQDKLDACRYFKFSWFFFISVPCCFIQFRFSFKLYVDFEVYIQFLRHILYYAFSNWSEVSDIKTSRIKPFKMSSNIVKELREYGNAHTPAFASECPIKTLFVMHPSHCRVFGGGMHRIKATSASECRFNCQISPALAQRHSKIMA